MCYTGLYKVLPCFTPGAASLSYTHRLVVRYALYLIFPLKGRPFMSLSELKTVNCPSCAGHNKVVLYQSINPSEDGTLRRDVLNDKLFTYTCMHCGYQARLTYPVLYNDVKRRFMIYFIPNCEKTLLTDRILEREKVKIRPVKKRLVTSYNDFKEKIIIFEAGLNDMAVELTKLALEVCVMREEKKSVREGYFSVLEDGNIGFTFFTKDLNEPFVKSTRMDVYEKSRSIVTRLARRERMARGFIKIDRPWAEEILYRYRKYGVDGEA